MRGESALAARNALTLAGSLVVTWGVALVVRLILPRWLGPEVFGTLSFAESFAMMAFVLLGLGIETYLQKEVAVRPEHASDLVGGLVVLRVVLAVPLLLGMAVVLDLTHRSAEAVQLVVVFGLAQLLVVINGSLAALLQASRVVGGLAWINIAAKLVWGAGVLFALEARVSLVGIALALVGAETLRAGSLLHLTRKRLALRLRVDLGAVRRAVAASVPFYLNAVANVVYAQVGITMLAVFADDTEVGWYGAASNLAGLALLVSPLVAWVLLPLLARAAARSDQEISALLRRVTRPVLLIVLPVALMLHVGADVWIPWVFGAPFAPAVRSLRVLAPMLVFTYVAMLDATFLLLRGRAWAVTAISLGGLVLNPTLNLLLVPRAARAFGPGAAGTAAATALLVTELSVTVTLAALVGRRAWSRASARSIAGAVLACLLVVALDLALRPLGPARLVLDVVAYGALAVSFGAVRVDEIVMFVRFILRPGRIHAAPR